jgi:hypothetical protein
VQFLVCESRPEESKPRTNPIFFVPAAAILSQLFVMMQVTTYRPIATGLGIEAEIRQFAVAESPF